MLTCAARGVEPCEACATGATNRCCRITVGHLAPGLQTGFCKDTGGGWGQQLVAHRSQLHVVPEGYSDEQALLIEPLACAVHTALRAGVDAERPGAGQRRRVGRPVRHARAARAHRRPARSSWSPSTATSASSRCEFGATEVVAPGEVLRRVRRSTGAFQLKPEFSAPYLLGGVDVAVDAVGSKQSLETALHATRAGGRVVLSGMPAARRPVRRVVPRARGRRHLRLRAAGAGADGRGAFDIATELVAATPSSSSPRPCASYPLHRWREALDHAHSAGRLGTVKVAFDPRSSR